MALVSIIQKDATTVFKTYKNKAGKDAALFLKQKFPDFLHQKRLFFVTKTEIR